jgi:prepilin-type N-terminal cleavage/methylation domain-containing protein
MEKKIPVRGFTLMELLITVALIALLSSVVLSSLATARAKARDTQRLQNLESLRVALESYRTTHGVYPIAGSVSDPQFSGHCSGWDIVGDYSGADGWIPNLAPTYIPALPADPRPGGQGTAQCYGYLSDGREYLIVAYGTVETYSVSGNPAPWPAFPGEPSFAFYTSGAKDWPL